MHQPSISTCGISPRCGSARRIEESLSRPSTGRRVTPGTSRPTSSSQRNELFFLTRPPSSGTQRLLSKPLFPEDVAVQRMRVSSARAQRTSEAAMDPTTPIVAPRPHPPVDRDEHRDDPFDDEPEPSSPFDWTAPPSRVRVEEVSFPLQKPSSAQPQLATSPDGSELPFSPMGLLRTLMTQRPAPRRPSRLPTPPVPPAIDDIINGGGRRRVSLFPQHTTTVSPDATPSDGISSTPAAASTARRSPDMELADAQTELQASLFRDGNEGTDAECKSKDVMSPEQARKRAFYAKMNDVIAIHAGVHLTVPSLPSLPHFQTMHPLDFAKEVNNNELPYSLRVGGYSPSATDAGVSSNAPMENRGFMTVAQWRREGRASNFVMPSISNPGPVVASGLGLGFRK